MRRLFALIALSASALATPAAAQMRTIMVVEEWVDDAPSLTVPQGIAAYGPFRVLDERRAALVDATDRASPAEFTSMLRDHPGIATLELIECPGTDDDVANLKLGRMIRAQGIATHVPAGGSVRSGAVELFVAGARRSIDDGAEFAVHAWRDSDGREPGDFAADSSVNRTYLEYYREMGIARPQAFYDMTNAVANAGALWLTAQDMRSWLGEERVGDVTVAYLDLEHGIP